MRSGQRLAVVTGASTGIGEATARALAGQGFHVLAGVRTASDAERITDPGLEPVIVDITNADQVAALADRVSNDKDGRPLAVLVNNAGIAVNAPVETMPLQEWRRQFEVNLFGHIAVTQALLPALLTARGRIVNVSSIGGKVAGPTFGAYAASKFALEAMSDALRREIGRLGVRVIVVEPGSVATPIWRKGLETARELQGAMSDAQAARYADLARALREQAGKQQQAGTDPADAANVIVKAIQARRPRTRYLIGRDAKQFAAVARVAPDRLLDRLIAHNLGLAR